MKPVLGMLFFLLSVLPHCFSQGGLLINSGAFIVCSGSPVIVVDNGNFDNSGTFNAASSKLKMTGTALNSIKGNTTTSFYQMEINKSNNNLQLLKGINVSNSIKFTTGNIDLGTQIATLTGSSTTLSGESESSRLFATSTGIVTNTGALNLPNNVNLGKIGAMITATTSNLGNTTIDRGHNIYTVAPGIAAIKRFYRIAPTNSSVSNAKLRLYYFDAELNNNIEGTLEIMRSTDNGVTWLKVTNGNITRDPVGNWVQRSGISTLSGMYTLASVPTLFSEGNDYDALSTSEGILATTALDEMTMSISPNPTNGILEVGIQSSKESITYLSLYSTTGQLMKSEQITIAIGHNQYKYDITQMPVGFYSLKCEDTQVHAVKVVKF